MHFVCYFCTYNVRFCSRASRNALHVLLFLTLANFQPDLRECTSRTTFVLTVCDFAAASGNALHVLLWHLKLATCQPELRALLFVLELGHFVPELRKRTARTTFALRSCELQPKLWVCSSRATFVIHSYDFNPELPRTKQVEPETTRDRESRRANNETTPNTGLQAKRTEKSNGSAARALRRAGSPHKVRREQDALARRHSESASPRTISAEGSPSSRQIRPAPQRERFDTQDLRRGARHHSRSVSTRRISAEGSPSSSHIRTAPQRQRFDTHNLRRGFAESKTNSHGSTAIALRHAGSTQRVHREQDKFARHHSESASTRESFA